MLIRLIDAITAALWVVVTIMTLLFTGFFGVIAVAVLQDLGAL